MAHFDTLLALLRHLDRERLRPVLEAIADNGVTHQSGALQFTMRGAPQPEDVATALGIDVSRVKETVWPGDDGRVHTEYLVR